jgi:hypothetical protein
MPRVRRLFRTLLDAAAVPSLVLSVAVLAL